MKYIKILFSRLFWAIFFQSPALLTKEELAAWVLYLPANKGVREHTKLLFENVKRYMAIYENTVNFFVRKLPTGDIILIAAWEQVNSIGFNQFKVCLNAVKDNVYDVETWPPDQITVFHERRAQAFFELQRAANTFDSFTDGIKRSRQKSSGQRVSDGIKLLLKLV